MEKNQKLSNFPLFLLIRKKSKIISIITLFAFLNLSVSCSYYTVKPIPTKPDNFASQYNSIKKKERYVILHSGNEIWHISDIELNEDKKELTATLGEVDYSHTLYPIGKNETSRRYYSEKSRKTFEIHLYKNEAINQKADSKIIIPFESITTLEVYEADTGKLVLSIIGFTVATVAVIAIIIALTKSSCPFVYIKDGDSYAFTGELYPGATLPTLERNDYIPLPDFKSKNEEYELKITNELLEIQYTDLAQLVVLNHPEDIEVLLGQNGKAHSISKKQSPEQVTIDDHSAEIEPSLKKDNISFLFNQERSADSEWNNIVLTFDNAGHSNQAKLVLTAKNSLWMDLVYGKFNEQFGSYFNQFQKQQHKVPAEKNIQWRNE
jgi:sporulation protein YlmC with PRC-barrel domain